MKPISALLDPKITKIVAEKKDSDDIKERTSEEYLALLAILDRFLVDFYNYPTKYISHTELMRERALNALKYAFEGYGITFDKAMDIIRNEETDDLTVKQLEERDMLVGLVDNIVYFSVAEEYQALSEMREDRETVDNPDDFMALAIPTFAKFNKTYSTVENGDILFAMGIAATWMGYESNEIIEYKTQGDERVRDSHNALDGIRYRKKDFPASLVPPIAFGCRCYLVNTNSTDGRILTNKSNVDELIDAAADPAFKYNVGVNGMMFSEAHPYFQIDSDHFDELNFVVDDIKKGFING